LVDLVFTVNPGIEDVVAEEIRSEFTGKLEYKIMSGRVYLYNAGIVKYLYEKVSRLKTINKAMILLWKGKIRPEYTYLTHLHDILIKDLNQIIEYITPNTTFAVQVERLGEHEYTSMDIARVLGDVIIDIVSRHYQRRPLVNLRNPSIIINALAKEDELIIGVLVSSSWSMHRRGYRIYDHPAALKPTLAVAMLYLSGTKDKQVIIDPMCGGGTIPIEAALLHEDAYIVGTDFNEKHIRGARMNSIAAGVYDKIIFKRWDARKIDQLGMEFDHIILNPPYGIRYGDPNSVRRLYRKFLESAIKSLRLTGRITMITTEYHYIHRIIKYIGLDVVHERTVYHGKLYPHIIVLGRK